MNQSNSKYPEKCPKCGGNLEERTGKYGKFLGCTNYPQCRYTYNLSGSSGGTEIICPDCKKSLRIRKGRYGQFLSCSGYPECKFAYNPEMKNQKSILCPLCGNVLEFKTDQDGKSIVCSKYPECQFTLEWSTK